MRTAIDRPQFNGNAGRAAGECGDAGVFPSDDVIQIE